jgi:CheY-like chemotaxis protein
MQPVQILLVEDSPDDILLTEEALSDAKIANELHSVMDGEAAMAFLRREGEHADAPRPDLVILDLNLPKKDGREVLTEIREDPELTSLPVIVLSTSGAAEDIAGSYARHVNAYIQKPVDFDEFLRVVRSMEEFWLSIVKLPSRAEG